MPVKSLIPLAFAKNNIQSKVTISILAGDVGGTKTNIALYRADRKGLTLLRESRYTSKEYHSLKEIISQFAVNELPDKFCMAVAGPVLNGKVKLTNLSWDLDSTVMSGELKVPINFINDLEANAYGLAGMHSSELAAIHSSDLSGSGNIAMISPGTGLGEAGLYFDGKKYHPFAAEGGHSDFAPRTEQDVQLWRYLQKQFGHVSWERVISGPGIHNIFLYLTTVEQKPISDALQKELREAEDPSAVISNAALHQDDPVCIETIQLFSKYLAVEAASLVLKLKSTGGCYLGGGIAPKVLSFLQSATWYQEFISAGRMEPLLKQVPVYVILNSKAALLGAAYYGAYNM